MTQGTVVVYSGNLLGHKILPQADLLTALTETFDDYEKTLANDPKATAAVANSECRIVPPLECHRPVAWNDSTNHSAAYITVKLFLPADLWPHHSQALIADALETYAKATNGAPIKHCIISLQNVTFSDQDVDEDGNPSQIKSEDLFDAWTSFTKVGRQFGKLHDQPQFVEEYGISEFSAPRLTRLLADIDSKSAEGEMIPVPTIDHINASDCCALPPTLIKVSRERNIKLLAHHDSEDMLPADRLQEFSSRVIPGHAVRWNWILRFTSIVKDRQVLAGNEYLVSLSPK